MGKEVTLEDRCRREANLRGMELIKLSGLVGISDRILLAPGNNVVLIEFKRPDGKGVESKIQEYWGAKFTKMGFKRVLCDDFGQFLKIVNEVS